MHEIKSATRQELKQPEGIRRILTFYTELYKSEYQEHQELFYSFGTLPRVPQNIATELEEPLTIHGPAGPEGRRGPRH